MLQPLLLLLFLLLLLQAHTGSSHGDGLGVSTRECEVKFECQMYKVRDDEYMVDVQVRRSTTVLLCSWHL